MGCAMARRLCPARRLKLVVAAIAIFAGIQLIWNGANMLHSHRIAAKMSSLSLVQKSR